jgi:drug/metabolite transporter (DMT)-like permease
MSSELVVENKMKGFLMAGIAALLWGVSGALVQYLFEEKGIDAGWLVTTRLLVSGTLFVTYGLMKNGKFHFRIWRNGKDRMDVIIFSVLGMLAVQYTYFIAIQHSNAATATVLQYLGPVFIAVYYIIVTRKAPNFYESLALIFAMAGTFLLVTHGNITNLAISNGALIWGLLSALTLAFYTIYPIRLLQKYSSVEVVGWSMLVGGIVFGLFHKPWIVAGTWDINTFVCTALIILFGTIIPFYIYLSALTIIGAKKASLLACAEPLSASFIAVIWLGVTYEFLDWMGSLLIVGTILLLSLDKKK